MKRLKIIFMFLIVLLTFSTNVLADETLPTNDLELGDYVFFDPVNNDLCNQDNYWTYYNQGTNCYRWNVINVEGNNIQIMLDHNITTSTFDDYQNILVSKTNNWKNISNVTIIDEATIKRIKKLTTGPTLDNISVSASAPYWMRTNTYLYYNNDMKIISYGYWSKTFYDDTYVYTITEYGNNRLTERNKVRGIRPIVTVNSSYLTASYKDHTIYPTLNYKFTYLTDKFDGYTYKQMQGFTFTNNKLIYASTYAGNPANSLIFTQSGTNYATRNYQYVENIGHANDMTYNSKTNKVLISGLSGGSSAGQIWIYDNSDMTKLPEKIQPKANNSNISYGGIAYDEYNDYYFGRNADKIYVLNNNYEPLYSFDAPFLETGQGLDYHNGFIYIPVYEIGNSKNDNASSPFQLYYRGTDYDISSDVDKYYASNRIYVYNAKFKNNGTPSDDFGKLVRTYFIPKYNNSNEGYGELETTSFLNNTLYLGFAAQKFDSTYTYKFYGYDEKKYNFNYDIISIINDDIKTTNIYANNELKSLNSWNQSNDLYHISKELNSNESLNNINICDLYNNCTALDPKKEIIFNELDIDLENNIIKHIKPQTSYNNIKDQITTYGTISSSNNGILKTDDTIKITTDKIYNFKISITGDFNSDGLANLDDAKLIAKYIIEKSKSLDEVKHIAADINNDNLIKMNDVMLLLKKMNNN